MTTRIYFGSNTLGEISSASLQDALHHFNLGTLIDYKRTEEGMMGQTLLVRSSIGEYILKGNPLYPGQLQEEKFFIEQLTTYTNIPVPDPYLLDEETDTLGWSYAIMPRLPGRHLHDPSLKASLSQEEQENIATMLAHALAELHRWKVPDAGEYDPVVGRIVPFAGTYQDWLYGTIRHWLQDAAKYSVITDEDLQWVDEQLRQAESAFHAFAVAGFVMGDFKVENFVIQKKNSLASEWEISGLFDFTTSYFGDGTADLTKITARYVSEGSPELAKRFLSGYRELVCATDAERCQHFATRLRIHLLYQRILLWGEVKATGRVTWISDMPFAQWAEQYLDSVVALLD
ncbi:aminoglycoside phosphotransferase family protein [Paenibacillus sp. JNUCC31]|uniref:phosphotransferase family protein n=1 Tax=Paenibacillus sp. JNUCC-31 TaxID=2777983 RepID=UPI00177D082C|nr:aminoglycoside phosphotransferase family protein [Paenibacillus sp. JNUCC-31]QOS76622.1 aminoglycoside phosphotransferase family protein [Paenibacillus sp. JNUCC-31]